jgi:hypothetical protein
MLDEYFFNNRSVVDLSRRMFSKIDYVRHVPIKTVDGKHIYEPGFMISGGSYVYSTPGQLFYVETSALRKKRAMYHEIRRVITDIVEIDPRGMVICRLSYDPVGKMYVPEKLDDNNVMSLSATRIGRRERVFE